MDFELSEDIVAIRDMVRKFAADEIRPHSREWDQNQFIPDEIVAKLGELGLMGTLTPEKYGGAELNYLANSVIIEEAGNRLHGQKGMMALIMG